MRAFALSTAAALACTLAIPVAYSQDSRYRYEGPVAPRYYEPRSRSYTIPDPAEVPRYYYKPAPRRDVEPAPPRSLATPLAPTPRIVEQQQPEATMELAPPPAPKIAETAPRPTAAPAPVKKAAATPAPRVARTPIPSLRTNRFTLPAKDLFEIDQATLRGDTRKLDEIAAMVRADDVGEVRISSYTDKLGPQGFNLKLSQRRADAVRDYLVRKGVPASRLKAIGRGEVDPVVYCGDDGAEWEWDALNKCLEPNRRIEVESVTFERAASRRS